MAMLKGLQHVLEKSASLELKPHLFITFTIRVPKGKNYNEIKLPITSIYLTITILL